MCDKRKIKAVLFDVDGTLIDTERMYMEAWRQAAIRQGFKMDEEYLLKTRAIDHKVCEEMFNECYPGFDYYKTWQLRVDITEKWFDELENPVSLHKKGMTELLNWLDENGYKKATASSTTRERNDKHFKAVGIFDSFDVTITGDMVERSKPFPDIFLLAADKLGVKPEECLVCEDSLAGIEAAYAAGMCPVFIEDCVKPTDRVREIAYRLPKSLLEIPQIIEELNS
ncbi:MAG: HAD family phosphatase [Eubacteriales bacterium]|nr:HAD family phosphatase [Eubacteriales bacterium]